MLFSTLCLGRPSNRLFLHDFRQIFCVHFLYCHMSSMSHHPSLIPQLLFDEECKYRSSLLCNILHPHPLCSQMFSTHVFPLMQETKIHAHKNSREIIYLYILNPRSYPIYQKRLRSLKFFSLCARSSSNYKLANKYLYLI